MARRRVRRTPKDWVYNNQTYTPVTITQGTGLGAASCYRLYDSVNHMLNARGSAAAPVFEHGHERADTRGGRYFALSGQVMIAPTQWALGNTINAIFALIITEQDPVDGSCLLDAAFNLGTTAPPDFPPGLYANQYTVVRVWRVQRTFSTSNDQQLVSLPIWWSSRRGRRLREQDGVFWYHENSTATAVNTAVATRSQFYLRSLVSRR